MREFFLCNRRFRWRLSTTFGMKSIFLLVGLFMFVFVVKAGGQQERVNLDLHDVTIKVVLDEIQKQTNLSFLFNPEQTDKIGTVSVQANNETVQSVLDRMFFGTDLMYRFRDDLIVIYQKTARATDEKHRNIRIAGRVTDEAKMPLPGVTVLVKDLNIGTATDADGRYKLTLPVLKDTNFVFIFSFVGYASQTINYTGQDTINVVMKEEVKKMDEVVVTGYLNVRKESFTGNVTTVNKDQLLKTNNKSVIAALQTFDPSFRIKENNIWGSDPNALPEFNIRGESSIDINKGLQAEQNRRTQRTNLEDNPNLPIFILDGFEVSVQKIYDMDINRIESITILKDAAATAMYGSQAANGVVVVTTIPPKPGEMRITYNFSGGADFPDLSDYNLCNSAEMLEVEKFAKLYEITGPGDYYKTKNYYAVYNNVVRGIYTDWMSKPLRNVFNHTHSLNLQGGEESIRYSLDLSYDSNKGVMKGSYRSRMGAGLTLDYRPKNWLQILNSITYNQTRSENSPYGAFSTYTSLKPYAPLYDEDGNMYERLVVGTYNQPNPLYKVENYDDYDGRAKDEDIQNNLNVNMYFLDGFQFKGSFSISRKMGKSESFTDPAASNDSQNDEDKGSLSTTYSNSWNWNAKGMFYYNKTVHESHFINATLGVELSESKSESVSATYTGFGLSNAHSPIYAAKQPNKSNVTSSKDRKIGILGAVNYSYNDIYLLDASFRFDASSKFGADKKWAPFWSVGVGLNLHNYAFMKNSWLVNTLKIRASYGSTGNVNFPSNMATTTYAVDKDSWYFTGPAAGLMALGNPKLTWEKTNTFDIGFNAGFLRDLIYLTASYYNKKTNNLIDQINIRTSSGFNSYSINAGGIKNEGIELNLNATVFRNNDWMVTLNANLAHNENTITELGEDAATYNQQILDEWENGAHSQYRDVLSAPVILYYVGASKTALYAVRSAGIDPANGRERFIKKNGMSTYTWDANDQVVVGDKTPDAQGSFGFNIAWKGFYVNTSFMYQWGGQTYNETLVNKVENVDIASSNVDKRVLTERWIKPGDITPFQALGSNTATQVTSRFVQNDNYVNFSSLSLGYDFNTNLISKWRLRTLGVRFNMNDLVRWSTIKEERGLSYPYARNFSFTINIGI